MNRALYGEYRLSFQQKILFVLTIVTTPLFMVINPFCFLIAYRYSLTSTETPDLYQPLWWKFLFFCFTFYLVINLWKYPFFALKKGMVIKNYSPPLYYIVHTVSQLPYLLLINQYRELWSVYHSNGFFGFVYYPWFLMLFIFSYFLSFLIYNGIVFYPKKNV